MTREEIWNRIREFMEKRGNRKTVRKEWNAHCHVKIGRIKRTTLRRYL